NLPVGEKLQRADHGHWARVLKDVIAAQ
ncbi:MAG: hypothetical protein JWQ55_3643, partial [Rhodopila sp.]|nr:hypothetical protein [Rhodopila sp.]